MKIFCQRIFSALFVSLWFFEAFGGSVQAAPPVDPPVHDPPPPDLPPPTPPPGIPPRAPSTLREAGLYEVCRAPTGRASCWCCGATISKNTWRFTYQIKRSSSLRDSRYIHSGCAATLPAATREEDIDALRRFITDTQTGTGDEALLDMLQEVTRAMAPSGSSGN